MCALTVPDVVHVVVAVQAAAVSGAVRGCCRMRTVRLRVTFGGAKADAPVAYWRVSTEGVARVSLAVDLVCAAHATVRYERGSAFGTHTMAFISCSLVNFASGIETNRRFEMVSAGQTRSSESSSAMPWGALK